MLNILKRFLQLVDIVFENNWQQKYLNLVHVLLMIKYLCYYIGLIKPKKYFFLFFY